MNIYPINNKTTFFWRNHIFNKKKVLKSWYCLDFRSDSEQDLEIYQNETDPQHCIAWYNGGTRTMNHHLK